MPTLPFTLPRWAWALGGFVLVGLLIWWMRSDAYRDGERAERSAWEQKAADMELKALRLQRLADELREKAEALAAAKLAANRQEVDNAVRNIPDQSTSARQRTRACLELMRQGKSSPACQPQPSGQSSPPSR